MITQHPHPAPSAATPERRTVCGTVCEVYSRVCGYFRPVAAWNKGKREEFKDRKLYTGALPRLVAVLLLLSVMILIAGCATYSVNKQDGSVTTAGFFRNLKVTNEYYETGALKKNEIVTESTTRDVMVAGNDLIDTAANTYSKLKP